MITTSSKFFFGATVAAWLGALAYGWSTGGDFWGPLTVGYLGGVGHHLGYGLLLTIAAVSAFIGFTVTAFRDADPDVVADMIGEATPPSVPPAGASYWPVLGAFGAGLTIVGLAVNNVFFVAGLITLGAVAIEWTIQAWSDRATGDPATNREIRNRIMYPVEIPLAGALAIAVVVLGLSRVLLAVSKENAVWVAIGLAAVVFGIGAILASRPTLRSDLVAGLVAVFAVGVIAAGIVGAVAGERDIEPHSPEGEEHGGDDGGDEADHSEEDAEALGADS